ncbi:DUF6678 family protein [Hymenobacter jeollabukensis]|uniref:Uncharacterized protein n=1 Tax=Hymenobacter jeollabukensis TaxID=2025313 RepID=A0A5R8WUB1_9BACT|nr:DUF6678 family protein [Hymenobacter jeollabukensis]TLM95360.1 hypothetical protein FDY95_06110 [Hymenobacter jeollabukensis]
MKEDPLTAFIYANQLASVMNQTKWRELADALTSNPAFEPEVRVQYLLDDRPDGFGLLEWDSVRHRDSRFIEWMDIDPVRRQRVGRLVDDTRTDFTPWVKSALERHSIPFTEQDGLFRIYGYLRPNAAG